MSATWITPGDAATVNPDWALIPAFDRPSAETGRRVWLTSSSMCLVVAVARSTKMTQDRLALLLCDGRLGWVCMQDLYPVLSDA